jgi:hypothetical protein
MYSWYMPKDSPSTGLGHRHDWENVVVWLSSASTTATVRGVAISAHGEYQKETSPPFSGTRPKIGYRSVWPVNHQLISTSDQGGSQPLIAWESMTPAARSAIANTVRVFHLGFPDVLMCTKIHGRILEPRPQALETTTFKIPLPRHIFRLDSAQRAHLQIESSKYYASIRIHVHNNNMTKQSCRCLVILTSNWYKNQISQYFWISQTGYLKLDTAATAYRIPAKHLVAPGASL